MVKRFLNLGQLTKVKNEKVENKSGDSSDFSQAVTFSNLTLGYAASV